MSSFLLLLLLAIKHHVLHANTLAEKCAKPFADANGDFTSYEMLPGHCFFETANSN